jgi:hypothetical protein
MSGNERLDAALAYAVHDWPVVALHTPTSFGPRYGPDRARCSCHDPDCDDQGKHPRPLHGATDASTDPDVIRRWWRLWPEANVGLRCGDVFDVLDIDGPDALAGLRQLRPADVSSIVGPTVCTGRDGGGWHVYVEPTGHGHHIGFRPGVDWQGRGCLVVAPPSVHYTDRRYEWATGPDTPIPIAPAWVVKLLPKPPPSPPCPTPSSLLVPRVWSPSGLVRFMTTCPEGKRNHVLYWAAWRLAEHRLAGAPIADALEQLNAAAVASGLRPLAVDGTIKSALVKAGVWHE